MSGPRSPRPTLRCDACISILRASGVIGRNRQSGKPERTYLSALLDLLAPLFLSPAHSARCDQVTLIAARRPVRRAADPVGDMKSLQLFELSEKGAGLPRVVPVSLKFRNDFSLVCQRALALHDVLFGLR
jgi:hypothetical protein